MDADESKILIKAHAYKNLYKCADYYLHFKGPISARRKIGSLEQCTVKPTLVSNLAHTYYGTAILIIN